MDNSGVFSIVFVLADTEAGGAWYGCWGILSDDAQTLW